MKTKKQIRVFLIVLIIILVVGGVSLFFIQKERSSDIFFEYNGFAVHKVNIQGATVYKTQLFVDNNPQPLVMGFRSNPKDLEIIPIEAGLKEKILKQELYITLDPELPATATLAYSEIDKVMENPFLFNLPTKPGFLKEVEGKGVEKVTCEDVTENKAIIKFQIGEENKIYSQGECVIVEAENVNDLIKGADRLIMTLIGIMNP